VKLGNGQKLEKEKMNKNKGVRVCQTNAILTRNTIKTVLRKPTNTSFAVNFEGNSTPLPSKDGESRGE